MRMRRDVLVALTVLGLAGCASTHTSDTPLKSGGIQTRELNSVIRGR